MKQNIKGMLSLEELEDQVKGEEIDTVLMVFTDLYGRFMGKRYDAEFFLEELPPQFYTQLLFHN